MNIIEWTHKEQDLLDGSGPHFRQVFKHENKLIDEIVRGSNQEFVEFVKD